MNNNTTMTDQDMQREYKPTTSDNGDFAMQLISVAFAVIMGYALLWGMISNIPITSYHQHADTCYTAEGDLICGKEEGELILKENPLPGPIDLIRSLEEASEE